MKDGTDIFTWYRGCNLAEVAWSLNVFIYSPPKILRQPVAVRSITLRVPKPVTFSYTISAAAKASMTRANISTARVPIIQSVQKRDDVFVSNG